MGENKKKLEISAALIDATKVTEEKLSAYGSVRLRCATLLMTQESARLLGGHAAQIETAASVLVSEGCRVCVVNGAKEIDASETAPQPTILSVNGKLTVLPDGGEALASYERVIVNGQLLCPDTAPQQNIQVNGSINRYPSGSTLLNRSVDMDPFFILRAGEGARYYITGALRITEEGLDLASLVEKRVRLQAGRVVALQRYCKEVAALLSGDINPAFVPEDCRYIRPGQALPSLIARAGKRLYLDGDLDLREEDGEALASLEALEVRGTAKIPAALEALFYQKCRRFGGVEILQAMAGASIGDMPEVCVTAALLEANPEGVRIQGCARVSFAPDIPAGLLRRVLSVEDCSCVVCSAEQEGLLLPVVHDVGAVTRDIKTLADDSVMYINCAQYEI